MKKYRLVIWSDDHDILSAIFKIASLFGCSPISLEAPEESDQEGAKQ